tara:strand:+ start:7305 stop:8102 length:798 start_codon:yes stop_codon:yes gene_type:complete
MSNETMTLLDGISWDKEELLSNMDLDSFYFGHLGKAALSSSACKELLKSSITYYHSITKEKEPTDALIQGSIFHILVLEPDKLYDRYEFFDAQNKTVAFKKRVEESDKEVVLIKNLYFMRSLKKYLDRCEDASGLLQGGIEEVPAIGFINGIPFRGKADYLKNNHIIDLKTTASLDNWNFTSRGKWDYDMQAYIYRELFNVDRFTFLVVEKITGRIGIYEASEECFESGKEKIRICTDRYKEDFLEKSNDEIESIIFNRCIHGTV